MIQYEKITLKTQKNVCPVSHFVVYVLCYIRKVVIPAVIKNPFHVSPDYTPEDLDAFYKKYIRLICFLVQKYAADPGLREDLVQETWLHLLENMETLRRLSDQQVAGYIATTVKRLCWHAAQEPEQTELDESLLPCVEDSADSRIQADQLLETLSHGDRQLLYQKYIFGYSSQELAGMYRTTQVNIRARVSRARKRLLEAMRKEEEL